LRLVHEAVSPMEPLSAAAPDETLLWPEAEVSLVAKWLRFRSDAAYH
jgi:hypothetical protein